MRDGAAATTPAAAPPSPTLSLNPQGGFVMRVRFTRDIDGFCAGLSHPRAGSEGDAPKPVAEALVRQRVAVLVETAEAPAVETAAAPAVETGEAPAGEQRRKPGRPRKRED